MPAKVVTSDVPAPVAKIGYIVIETIDVDRMVDHYTRVLDFSLVERTNDEAFLATGFDHHSVAVRKGEGGARAAVGYQVKGSIADAYARLQRAGCEVERRSDIAPSTPDVLVLREPGTGNAIHLYEEQALSGVTGYTPLRPIKLGHVAAFVDDIDQIRSFYEGLLGFRWSDTIGSLVFLRCNADHHAANFLASKTARGMHHVAYEMRDLNHLQTMLDHLASCDRRLEWGPGRHGPGHNIFTYHADPDGNTVELFTQLDVILDDERGYFEPRPWHTEFPQFPKIWEPDPFSINSWGPGRLAPTVSR